MHEQSQTWENRYELKPYTGNLVQFPLKSCDPSVVQTTHKTQILHFQLLMEQCQEMCSSIHSSLDCKLYGLLYFEPSAHCQTHSNECLNELMNTGLKSQCVILLPFPDSAVFVNGILFSYSQIPKQHSHSKKLTISHQTLKSRNHL